jgi:5-methylcytosine-specific restriction endonuclease McrA
MQNYVFVLDTNKHPQDPCHPAEARKLLRDGHAAVNRRFPFTIILKVAKPNTEPAPIQLKLDPGSKATGIALVQNNRVIFAAELTHRGQAIRNALEKRRAIRRGRRARKTRYRQPRFNNRTRPKGWLAPSLKSRVDNIQTWFTKLLKIANITTISMELVRFDTQLLENAEISGVEYQQGELAGYEVREYLLEKFNRTCAYCGAKETPLEIEHITPRARGGSNRISNLALACHTCNQTKGSQTAAEFGHPEVQAKARQPLKDAAAVNATRWAIWRMLSATGLPIEAGTGGRTKFNRTTQGYPKAHWIDAACVGESGSGITLDPTLQALDIKAMGRGTRQMCRMDQYGFPRTTAKTAKRVNGFQTGDMVQAIVPTGKQAGTHNGRVVVRAKGSFRVGKTDGIAHRHCRLIQRVDGYNYTNVSPSKAISYPSPCLKAGVSRRF